MTYLIIWLINYLIISYSIFVLAKNTGVNNSWLSWIPLFHYYVLIKIVNKNIVKYLFLPFSLILNSFLLFLLFWNTKGWTNFIFEVLWWLSWFLIYLTYWYFLVKYITILYKLSNKIWMWKKFTVWLFFLPVIFFPFMSYISVSNIKKWELEWLKK